MALIIFYTQTHFFFFYFISLEPSAHASIMGHNGRCSSSTHILHADLLLDARWHRKLGINLSCRVRPSPRTAYISVSRWRRRGVLFLNSRASSRYNKPAAAAAASERPRRISVGVQNTKRHSNNFTHAFRTRCHIISTTILSLK